jgi:hypothetical protein
MHEVDWQPHDMLFFTLGVLIWEYGGRGGEHGGGGGRWVSGWQYELEE